MSRIAAFLAMVAVAACAKQEPPPGTPPDRTPPQVEETWPPYGDSVSSLDGDAWIRFDEPLSDPRGVDRSLEASPAGVYMVTPARSRIRIRPESGWREGVVYYFRIPTGLADLVRNRTQAPVELLFGIGSPVPPTVVQGRAYDRVTGRGTRGARLLFLSADSIPYTAVSDTGGVFRLPGLPYGSYDATVFVDQDRDLNYDAAFEPGAVVPIELSEDSPSLSFDAWMIPADSTPPVLASAEVIDSLSLRLTFDDPLDPDAPLDGVSVVVQRDEGGSWTVAGIVVGRPPADTEDPGEPAAAARPTPAAAFLTVSFEQALEAGSYGVSVSGVPNLRGLPGGGDTTLVYEPPVPPDPTPEEETP